MIEVEKDFILTEEQKKALIEGAKFISEKKIIDVYYDTTDYFWTKQDTWLRNRDGRWELKYAQGSHGPSNPNFISEYRELETEEEIKKHLKLKGKKTFEKEIAIVGLQPMYQLVTLRKKYKKDIFEIVFDSTDFDYEIAEIELMVDSHDQIKPAGEKIIQFAKAHGLKIEPLRGKLIKYISLKNPEHFKLLETAGVA